MGRVFGHLGLEVVFADVVCGGSGGHLGVGDSLKGDDGELSDLAPLDVNILVPVGLGDTGNPHETVLGSADRHSGGIEFDVGMAVVHNFFTVSSKY